MHDVLQNRRLNACISPEWCVVCKNSRESISQCFSTERFSIVAFNGAGGEFFFGVSKFLFFCFVLLFKGIYR